MNFLGMTDPESFSKIYTWVMFGCYLIIDKVLGWGHHDTWISEEGINGDYLGHASR